MPPPAAWNLYSSAAPVRTPRKKNTCGRFPDPDPPSVLRGLAAGGGRTGFLGILGQQPGSVRGGLGNRGNFFPKGLLAGCFSVDLVHSFEEKIVGGNRRGRAGAHVFFSRGGWGGGTVRGEAGEVFLISLPGGAGHPGDPGADTIRVLFGAVGGPNHPTSGGPTNKGKEDFLPGAGFFFQYGG